MNRSPSIIVVSAFLVLLALRLLTGHPNGSTNLERLMLSGGFTILAVLSVFTAAEIWRRSRRALRLFVGWLIAYLTVGGATQVIFEGASLSEVAIWWVVVGAIGLAVAAHLRYVLRQAV